MSSKVLNTSIQKADITQEYMKPGMDIYNAPFDEQDRLRRTAMHDFENKSPKEQFRDSLQGKIAAFGMTRQTHQNYAYMAMDDENGGYYVAESGKASIQAPARQDRRLPFEGRYDDNEEQANADLDFSFNG